MPGWSLLDLERMLLELEELEIRERGVSALQRKLHDRLETFPNEVTQARERQVSAEQRELHRRIDALRAELRSRLGRAAAGEQPSSAVLNPR